MNTLKTLKLNLALVALLGALSSNSFAAGASLNTWSCFLDVPASRHLLGSPFQAYGKTEAVAQQSVLDQCEQMTRESCDKFANTNNLVCSRSLTGTF